MHVMSREILCLLLHRYIDFDKRDFRPWFVMKSRLLEVTTMRSTLLAAQRRLIIGGLNPTLCWPMLS